LTEVVNSNSLALNTSSDSLAFRVGTNCDESQCSVSTTSAFFIF